MANSLKKNRYVYVIKYSTYLKKFFYCYFLDLCDTYDELKHISICLTNLPWFLNKFTIDKFVEKVKSILLNKPQNDDKIKCTIKVLRLLNNPYWSSQNIDLIRSLLLELQGSIKKISVYDMIQLQMV